MIIEKSTVIKALKTEPLQYGAFFAYGGRPSHKTCPVCAVGAVIRKSLGRKINKSIEISRKYGISFNLYCQEVTLNKYTGFSPEVLLKDKNYLGALSCYFESFDRGGGAYLTPDIENKLVEFVRKNFPTRFKVRDFEEVAKSYL